MSIGGCRRWPGVDELLGIVPEGDVYISNAYQWVVQYWEARACLVVACTGGSALSMTYGDRIARIRSQSSHMQTKILVVTIHPASPPLWVACRSASSSE